MNIRILGIIVLVNLLLTACSTTKFVPEGEFLLDKVHIKTDNKDIPQNELKDYLRQTPNAAVFQVFRMQLGIYNLAGKDSTKWINKTFKRMGDPPVIYNKALTSLSVQQLQRFLVNKGYINAVVESNVITTAKKAIVDYNVKSNKPYSLRNYAINLKNISLTEIAADTSRSLIRSNMLFDADVFNAERERIATRFRQQGFYNFNKDFLTYTADSSLNLHKIDLSLELRDNLKQRNDSVNKLIFKKYTIRKVIFYTNPDVATTADIINKSELDTVGFRNFILVSPKNRIIKLDALIQNTFINPQSLYTDEAVDRTYQALNSLGPIKYVNISFKELADSLLDCYIIIIPSKAITISTELEATYTDGYWGGAGNINFMHRNIFKGAETFSMQVRGAYEWQKGIWAQELGVQVGLKFPKFILPFGGYDFKRNIHANTEFTSAFNSQFRPGDYSTKSLGAGVKYTWNIKQFRHSFELFDLSYVYFDSIYQGFRDKYLNDTLALFNPYNYQDHFIMRIGYAGSYNTFNANRPMKNYLTMRYSVETAGNMMYALNNLLGTVKNADGSFRFFGIRYSQYIKTEYNITRHQIFDKSNRFVYHLGVGLGIPYGNADVIPYEKRFFSGGANSIRGWSESTLGPGKYQRIDDKRRDYNQVGDIKLDMSMEYRAKMFWVLEGAAFLDAGNIWTIKDYETQKGGTFKFDSFMNQIAIAYGLGLRFDFSFFIARVDFGVKLFDPVRTRREQWRVNPSLSEDFAVHLAIGYPF
jgi:outer membrane protein assembly factor BamA